MEIILTWIQHRINRYFQHTGLQTAERYHIKELGFVLHPCYGNCWQPPKQWNIYIEVSTYCDMNSISLIVSKCFQKIRLKLMDQS